MPRYKLTLLGTIFLLLFGCQKYNLIPVDNDGNVYYSDGVPYLVSEKENTLVFTSIRKKSYIYIDITIQNNGENPIIIDPIQSIELVGIAENGKERKLDSIHPQKFIDDRKIDVKLGMALNSIVDGYNSGMSGESYTQHEYLQNMRKAESRFELSEIEKLDSNLFKTSTILSGGKKSGGIFVYFDNYYSHEYILIVRCGNDIHELKFKVPE